MIGACGLLLVMFVLKPVGQQVMATLKEPVLLAPGAARSAGALGAGDAAAHGHGAASVKQIGVANEPVNTMAMNQPDAVLPAKRRGKNSAQAIFDSITENIQTDATQSTRLLQGWIAPEPEQPQA